ncbi:hypothetical protein [Bosea sp. RAC05]|uniref:hypothetical protein n=1 Tax=Bosea sp. RAC05 TaxID=1842539 RepID=UPI00083D8B14|nr:hypothetical protein [Bosea sp. RAC05]AOG03182.1 hypothetical protein BSY19_5414 [Bosea sp. RAC05]
MTSEDAEEILSCLEAGSGEDRALDWAIAWALDLAPWADEPKGLLGMCMIGSKRDKASPRFTGSIDAAVALASSVQDDLSSSPADLLVEALDQMMVRGWRPSEPNGPQIARAMVALVVRQVALNRVPAPTA